MANQDYYGGAADLTARPTSGAGSSVETGSTTVAEMKDQVKEKVSQAAHQAKETALGAMHDAKEKAADTVSQLRQQGESMAGRQKDRMADEVARIGEAIRKTSDGLMGESDRLNVGEYTRFCADRFDQGAKYLKERQVGEIAGDVENFVRRHPEVVFGGLFLGGLVFGRFLKASRPRDSREADFDPRFEGNDRRFIDDDAYNDDFSDGFDDDFENELNRDITDEYATRSVPRGYVESPAYGRSETSAEAQAPMTGEASPAGSEATFPLQPETGSFASSRSSDAGSVSTSRPATGAQLLARMASSEEAPTPTAAELDTDVSPSKKPR